MRRGHKKSTGSEAKKINSFQGSGWLIRGGGSRIAEFKNNGD
jgi:hypothetical protein